MFYLMINSTHFIMVIWQWIVINLYYIILYYIERKKVKFNVKLNTFYFGYMMVDIY